MKKILSILTVVIFIAISGIFENFNTKKNDYVIDIPPVIIIPTPTTIPPIIIKV